MWEVAFVENILYVPAVHFLWSPESYVLGVPLFVLHGSFCFGGLTIGGLAGMGNHQSVGCQSWLVQRLLVTGRLGSWGCWLWGSLWHLRAMSTYWAKLGMEWVAVGLVVLDLVSTAGGKDQFLTQLTAGSVISKLVHTHWWVKLILWLTLVHRIGLGSSLLVDKTGSQYYSPVLRQ